MATTGRTGTIRIGDTVATATESSRLTLLFRPASEKNPHAVVVFTPFLIEMGITSLGQIPADLLPIFKTPAGQSFDIDSVSGLGRTNRSRVKSPAVRMRTEHLSE